MAYSRYTYTRGPEPNTKSMSTANSIIRQAVINQNIPSETLVLEEGRRLDQIAGQVYGDSSYWWILAAASGIGWGLQLPPGTLVVVPDLGSVLSILL